MIERSLLGSIITISSQMGHVGGSKHAVEGFTKAMALEPRPHNIRANTIYPTLIRTAMTEATFQDLAMRAVIDDKIALGRAGRVEDVMG